MTRLSFLLFPVLTLLLVALPMGCTSTSPSPSQKRPGAAAEETTDDPRAEAMAARAQAEVAQSTTRAAATSKLELVERADSAFEDAEAARFNSHFRAATKLYLEAAELYQLSAEVPSSSKGTAKTPSAAPASVVSDQPVPIPAMSPIAGASPQAVEALFAEVDRVQRLAYTSGALESAPELIKEADTELWDAQIAQRMSDYEVAAGHLERIQAIYAEAYRRARSSPSASSRKGPASPVTWLDSLTAAQSAAKASGKPVLLLLYDRVNAEIAGLFSDPDVCAAATAVVPCKHRVTEILSQVDPSFMTEDDQSVRKLINTFGFRSFPVLLLLGSGGEYLDSRPVIAGRETVMELLTEASR